MYNITVLSLTLTKTSSSSNRNYNNSSSPLNNNFVLLFIFTLNYAHKLNKRETWRNDEKQETYLPFQIQIHVHRCA
jgi:hypothetical protein